MKILLVDDEKDIVEFLEYNLIQEGFEVVSAFDGKEALEKLKSKPDLIILDVLMPKMDGYETCEKIRKIKEFKNTPIIFLTAKSAEVDEIKGLNLGADDFIRKPISPKKLIARVKSNLRKSELLPLEPAKIKEIKIGPLLIDKEKYTVLLDGKNVVFPRKEFEILSFLAANPGKVYHRDKILADVWGTDIFVVERTVDVHIRKIREKLGKYSDLIETLKGVGYRFKSH
jgi:two-component system alkaline phosphatase synthesis response regulator PhoP